MDVADLLGAGEGVGAVNRNEVEETVRLMRQIAAHRERADELGREVERYRLAWVSARQRAAAFGETLDQVCAQRDGIRTALERTIRKCVRREAERDDARAGAVTNGQAAERLAGELAEARRERDEARAEVAAVRELERWRLAFGSSALDEATDRLVEALDRCKRPWTEDERGVDAEGNGFTTVTLKRCCNGCGERLGDVTEEEIEAGVSGRPLPDVRAECMTCTPLGSTGALRAALDEERIEPEPIDLERFDSGAYTTPVSEERIQRVIAAAGLGEDRFRRESLGEWPLDPEPSAVHSPLSCQTCGSPDPRTHPAVGGGGEVTSVCPDAFHGRTGGEAG